jgi:hypothetical protein
MKATLHTHNTGTMNSSEPLIVGGSAVAVQPTLIQKKELAKRLSVSPRTIDGWVARRVIPCIKISPRFNLYEFDAVLAALKKNYQVDPAV